MVWCRILKILSLLASQTKHLFWFGDNFSIHKYSNTKVFLFVFQLSYAKLRTKIANYIMFSKCSCDTVNSKAVMGHSNNTWLFKSLNSVIYKNEMSHWGVGAQKGAKKVSQKCHVLFEWPLRRISTSRSQLFLSFQKEKRFSIDLFMQHPIIYASWQICKMLKEKLKKNFFIGGKCGIVLLTSVHTLKIMSVNF